MLLASTLGNALLEAAVSCPTHDCAVESPMETDSRQQAKEPGMRTPICERLDIEFPIFAFSHCRDVVAAVSRAGGYGVLGALAFSPEQLEIELNWIDEHIDSKPYGVDIVMPAKYVGKGGGAEASIDSLDALDSRRAPGVRRRAARRVRHPAAARGAERWCREGRGPQRRRRRAGTGRGVAAAPGVDARQRARPGAARGRTAGARARHPRRRARRCSRRTPSVR